MKYRQDNPNWERMKKDVDEMFPTKRKSTRYRHTQGLQRDTKQRYRNGYPLDSDETKARVIARYRKRKEKQNK